MTNEWIQLEKCKKCGGFPMVLKKGKKHQIFCQHVGADLRMIEHTKHYETPQEWNEAQKQ